MLLFTCHTHAKEPLWFNSGMNNRDITFSPDGMLMLTTVVAPKNQFSLIALSTKKNGAWTELEVAPFSGKHPDLEAAFHPDGDWVYFASRRPKPGREGNDWDLWRVSWSGEYWGTPENLGRHINTTADEFYPSVTRDGTIYFTATREEGLGHEDLYSSKLEQGQYLHVTNLGEPVNSAAYEFNAFIAPDETYLIFGSQLREGETGGGDLYISMKQATGFSAPRLLPPSINTMRLDYCPTVFNGRFYFTTEQPADIDLGTVQKIADWYQSPGNGLGDIYSVPLADILN